MFAVTFTASLVVVFACYPPPSNTAWRCRPSKPDCPNDNTDYRCCSDDATAIDLDDLGGLVLPAYEGRFGTGSPVFSDLRNDAGDSGMCIQIGSVAPAFALTNDCPVPCNPTWDGDSVEAVCGAGTFCCQTLEIEPDDCVFDPSLGDDGCWRPFRGDDILDLAEINATTLQDPDLSGCESFVEGLTDDELDNAGVTAMDVQIACVRRLGVANQRGYCIGGPGVAGCPLAQPSYRDACEQRNDSETNAGCS